MALLRSQSSSVSCDSDSSFLNSNTFRRSHSMVNGLVSHGNSVRNNLTDGIAKMQQVLNIITNDLFPPGMKLTLSKESCLRQAPELKSLFDNTPIMKQMELTEATLSKMSKDVQYTMVDDPAFIVAVIRRAQIDIFGIMGALRSGKQVPIADAKCTGIDGVKVIMAKTEIIKQFLMNVYNEMRHVTSDTKC